MVCAIEHTLYLGLLGKTSLWTCQDVLNVLFNILTNNKFYISLLSRFNFLLGQNIRLILLKHVHILFNIHNILVILPHVLYHLSLCFFVIPCFPLLSFLVHVVIPPIIIVTREHCLNIVTLDQFLLMFTCFLNMIFKHF